MAHDTLAGRRRRCSDTTVAVSVRRLVHAPDWVAAVCVRLVHAPDWARECVEHSFGEGREAVGRDQLHWCMQDATTRMHTHFVRRFA
jgi:hypothetical protein